MGATIYGKSQYVKIMEGYSVFLDCDLEDMIRNRLKRQPRVRLLDIGCGEGRALKELAEKLGAEQKKVDLIGIDLHITSETKPVTWIEQDIATYVAKPFDIITSVLCFGYVPDKLRVIEHVYNNLLAPNGDFRFFFKAASSIKLDKKTSDEVVHVLRSTIKSPYYGDDRHFSCRKTTPAKIIFPFKLQKAILQSEKETSTPQIVSIYREVKK